MNAFITAQGFAKVGMYTVLIGAAANIVLDPIFIFALGMGVRGAALATVLSQGSRARGCWCSCAGRRRFCACGGKPLRLAEAHPAVRGARPGHVHDAGERERHLRVLQRFPAQVRRRHRRRQYDDPHERDAVCHAAAAGHRSGAQPITSYNFGAKNTDRVRETFHLLLKVCLIYSVSLWLLIELFPGLFARIFTPDAELIAFTARVLRIYCAGLFLFGIQIACQMTFVSIGSAVCSIIVAVLRKFVLLLPLIYLLPALLPDQTTAVYLAEPVADVIAVTCTAILFATQFRKALHKLEANA